MMRILLSVLILAGGFNIVFSQTDSIQFPQNRNCGTVQHNLYMESKFPIFKTGKFEIEKKIKDFIQKKKNARISNDTTLLVTIPVVVHIIHNNKSGTIGGSNNNNISVEQIQSQIDVLNEDYRREKGTMGYNNNLEGEDIRIKFNLATRDPNCYPTTGITRHYTRKLEFDMDFDNASLKSLTYWPSDEYLNIWVCSLSGGILGYAQFPNYSGLPGLSAYANGTTTDGVVIHHQAFGRNIGTATGSRNLYKYGRSTTHEIGHWLGLKHTWGDEICGDDFCDDTPLQQNATRSKITCSPDTSFCNNDTTLIPPNNYMDYSADKCMNLFTKKQAERMHTVLQVSPNRLKLFSSKGCLKTSSEILPLINNFENTNDNWQETSSDSIIHWTINGNGNNSSQSLKCDNTIFKKNHSYVDYDSPFLNLKNLQNPVLLFDIAYPNTIKYVTDTLILLYSNNCKSDIFIPFDTLTGNRLITTASEENNFKPQHEDWKTVKYDLPFLNGIKQARIRFRSISNNVSSIYLDNILVEIVNPNCFTDNENNIYFERLSLVDNEEATIKIYDCTGKFLLSMKVANDSYEKFSFNLNFLASGLYFATLESNSKSYKLKFAIIH